MIKLALRGLAARKRRVAMTAFAVLLGVTMISGTYVFTDTFTRAFENIFGDAAKGADAVVSGRQDIDSDFNEPPSIGEATIRRVVRVPGVKQVEGQVSDVAALVKRNGKVVKTGGAPTIAVSFMHPPFQALTVAKGRYPHGPGEVAIDQDTAHREGFEVGRRVVVATDRPRRAFKVTGLVKFGGASIGGATFVVFDLPTAQSLFLKHGKVDFLSVAAKSGVSDDTLVRRIKRVLPSDAQVRTASAQVNKDVADLDLGFLKYALLAFGYIALFVGAFVIFNTFSITVAQRTREFALLRTLGATRRQVLGSVIVEALTIGVLASVAGLALGLLTAKGIKALFSAADIRLPSTAAVLVGRTVIASLIVGVLVTLAAGLIPALRATRVSPVEALHSGITSSTERRGRVGTAIAVLLALAGAAVIAQALASSDSTTQSRLISSALGAVAIIVATALISPRAVRPLAGAAGWPLQRMTHVIGRLARENASRNRSRTAVTSAALMIGLALVLFVTVFANGLRESVNQIIERSFTGDFMVYHEDGFSPIPSGTTAAVAQVPGVGAVSAIAYDDSKLGRAGKTTANGVDPATIGQVYKFDWVDGSDATLQTLGRDGALLEEQTAREGDYHVGDRVTVKTPASKATKVVVRGIYKDDAFLSGYSLPLGLYDRLFRQKRIGAVLVKAAPGADKTQIKRELKSALKPFPEARARDQQEIKDESADQINQLLTLLYALLAMSVLVSLFGIVNTLTLTIYERTRELGMLRAVGMSRRQVRRLVRYESVITALIGGLLGLPLGTFLAWIMTRALENEGIVFAIPWGQLAVFVLVAVLAGVVAAISPARRAARLDVLEAIAYE